MVVLTAAAGLAQAPAQADPVDFAVFFQGYAVGREQVSVVKTPEGILISGTERIAEPLNVIVRRGEVRYTTDWRPLECLIDGSIRNEQVLLHSTVSGTTATSAITQGKAIGQKTDQIAADAVFLPNLFFGAYEALAARLAGAKVGDELRGYHPAQASVKLTVKRVTDDRVRTQQGLVSVRQYAVQVTGGQQPLDIEVWTDPDSRLLRVSVISQAFDVVRTDIASITSRREPVARPNDEHVQVPSNGFSLAGTLSRPATAPAPKTELPAVVLVGGSGPTDRDEVMAGVPIFGQLASALADAGYIVLRYDKRGTGQSGGRPESVTLGDYADDVVAAVKYMQRRKDVAARRVAVLGYGEGGAVAATAAARSDEIAAVVLLEAPGVTGYELSLEQQRHVLSMMKITDADRQAKIALQEKLQKAVMSGRGFEGIPSDIRRQADTPWFQSFLLYDPAKVIKDIERPILIVHGELDRQIAVANADKLEALAKARKKKGLKAGVTVVKVPGMNHLLLASKTGEVDEYEQLAERKISAEAVSAVVSWLGTAMRAR